MPEKNNSNICPIIRHRTQIWENHNKDIIGDIYTHELKYKFFLTLEKVIS